MNQDKNQLRRILDAHGDLDDQDRACLKLAHDDIYQNVGDDLPMAMAELLKEDIPEQQDFNKVEIPEPTPLFATQIFQEEEHQDPQEFAAAKWVHQQKKEDEDIQEQQDLNTNETPDEEFFIEPIPLSDVPCARRLQEEEQQDILEFADAIILMDNHERLCEVLMEVDKPSFEPLDNIPIKSDDDSLCKSMELMTVDDEDMFDDVIAVHVSSFENQLMAANNEDMYDDMIAVKASLENHKRKSYGAPTIPLVPTQVLQENFGPHDSIVPQILAWEPPRKMLKTTSHYQMSKGSSANGSLNQDFNAAREIVDSSQEQPPPSGSDVLMGHSPKLRNHSGNVQLRELVVTYYDKYFASLKPKKTMIAEEVIDTIKTSGGRFLKSLNDKWVEVKDHVEIRDKVASTFRGEKKKRDKKDQRSSRNQLKW